MNLSRRRWPRFCLAALVAAPILAPPADAQQASAQAGAEPSAYVIGVGDLLRVTIWRNPELEATVPVRPDGRVSLPLVGDVDVAGLTTDLVREALTRRYEEFVNAPGVSVLVTEIHSRKIYILGEVTEPGAYDLLQPMKLLQALALAGGLTEFARRESITLLRDVDGRPERLALSLKKITSGAAPDPALEPGDTIFVP